MNSNLNLTYNTIGRENATTWGPSFSVSKLFFDKTLNTQISTSYNQSNNISGKINTGNIRLGASYTLAEKHNFNFNIIQLFRKNKDQFLNETTSTIAYSYSFGLKKPKLNLNLKRSNILSLKFKDYNFKGTKKEITQEILNLSLLKNYKDSKIQKLSNQLKNTEKTSKKEYKKNAIHLLKYANSKALFNKKYKHLLHNAFLKLYNEAKLSDQHFEKELYAIDKTTKPLKVLKIKHKLKTHRKIISTIEKWKINKAEIEKPTSRQLKRFITNNFESTFKINDQKDIQITNQLELKIIKYIEKL